MDGAEDRNSRPQLPAVIALAIAAAVAAGLAAEDALGSLRWLYVPGILAGPLVSLAAAATRFSRAGAVAGAVLCWSSVVATMPFFAYGLALLPSAVLLTLAAASRGRHARNRT